MDITEKPVVTAVEWFHGYGGNALGLKRAIPGLRSVAVCERDAFVVANMVAKMEAGLMDAVPIWTDVTDFPCEPFGRGLLDLFIASYPCQGFSHAGKRLGTNDPRHLWPSCRRFIQHARPGLVWLENVEGHISLGLSTVLSDLEEDGYRAAWGIFSASEVGAPHRRKRVFILAHSKMHDRGIMREWGGTLGPGFMGQTWPSRPGQPQHGWEPPRVVENTFCIGRHGGDKSGQEIRGSGATKDKTTGPDSLGEGIRESNSQTQPPVGRNADGPAAGVDLAGLSGLSDPELAEIREWMVKGTNRTDELRMCGNGVVPQTAERAFRVLYAELTGSAGAKDVVLTD